MSKQLPAYLLLVSESGGIDGRQAHQKALLAGEAFVKGLDGVVGDLVVVALVAKRGSELRGVGETVLPVVFKDLIEGFAVGLNGSCRGLRVQSSGRDEKQERGEGQEGKMRSSQRSWTS